MKRRQGNVDKRNPIRLFLFFAAAFLFLGMLAALFFWKPHPEPPEAAEAPPAAAYDSAQTSEKVVLPVPLLAQGETYPTGCESVSTAMLLQYWGINISVDDLIAALPQEPLFQDASGPWHGPDPNHAFVGSPYTEDSFGCYAPVIADTVRNLLPEAYVLFDASGTPLPSLSKEYVQNGIPVLIWASIGMQEPYPGMSWYLEDGSLFTWLANEHCLVLTGYDESSYYLNDPSGRGASVSYPKALVEARYNDFSSQALVILPTETHEAP